MSKKGKKAAGPVPVEDPSSAEAIIPILKNVTIFSGFGEEHLHRIFKDKRLLTKRKGEIIIEEGAAASEIYIILRGRVTIILDKDNDPIELAEFGPGDCLGEASVIGVQKHSASVIAKEDAELIVLTRTMLMDIFDSDKGTFSMLILNIARELARRLHRTDQVLLHYGKRR
jgi:CRP/FNR family transcriptional regulator, cyclic AMP receptor protein